MDQQRAKRTQFESRVDTFKDKLRDIQLESQPVLPDDHPITRQIRVLENRLDKAMIKYNEAVSIKKTYEMIVKKLKDERGGR